MQLLQALKCWGLLCPVKKRLAKLPGLSQLGAHQHKGQRIGTSFLLVSSASSSMYARSVRQHTAGSMSTPRNKESRVWLLFCSASLLHNVRI